ncbi:MAG: succinyl-CoA--3-ketoacid-CoA transferase [Elusimicrobia bacterium RIFCSPLOWO2_12_FULL_59_9]|nr:MAG: succinyl-CoA--3-ketoacid-CoA transferase [Elusimicrobia bacterium RIFCSPLOWO2_12_FULL_59_9]
MSKLAGSSKEAVRPVFDGASIMLGGFGLCGIPENLIRALADSGVKNLTLISNNAGTDEHGIGLLLKNGQVKKMIMSYGGECAVFEKLVLEGRLEVEWTPQGTLAERIRAQGAGIGGFYTPTGYGTVVAEGKETRQIDGKWHLLEKPLGADFAFVRAHQADEMGNLVFRKTARNFNAVMATAAETTVAEVESVVAAGALDPERVHTPGIYVQTVVRGERYAKPIEKRVVRRKSETAAR